MPDRPPFDAVSFDPAPRPGEVAGIVARARRRKALRAVVPLSSVVALALGASLLATSSPRANQQLEIADDPLTAVTETARPVGSAPPAPSFKPGFLPAPTPSGVVLPPPPLGTSASPTPSRPPQSSRSPRPGERRPYRGELGPRVEEYGYPECRQSQLAAGSQTTVHRGFCIQPSFTAPASAGSTDLAPTLSVCWQMEAHYHGFLKFGTQEEADFALYEADVDDQGRTVAGRKLYRFSDSVTYTQRPHERRVFQGDCFVWQARLPFDRARHAGGDFLLRLETKSTTFDRDRRVYDFAFSV